MQRKLSIPNTTWLLVAALFLVQCATNPATGRRELSLVSEGQEVEIGRSSDPQIVAQYGLYPDDEMQTYVQSLGEKLARESERPDLPWTFRVLDDPIVNAFALPGGFIYVTRGIMTHLSSEAELVGVLGHEIGHVTARHGASQMTKAQLAQLGLGLGSVLSRDIAGMAGTLSQGLGLLFLKFGRDDEREADDLGIRYSSRTGYPPGAMAEVFGVLKRVGEASGAGRLPSWLSSHPDPENRRGRVEAQLANLPREVVEAPTFQESYLRRLEGMTFGEDARQGFFRDGLFIHPDLDFQMEIPQGWQGQNARSQVAAISPEKDAIFVLTLAQEGSAREAAEVFFRQSGVQAGGQWLRRLGSGAVSQRFQASNQNQVLQGGVVFAEQDGRIYRLLGYTEQSRWSRYERAIGAAASSFRRLQDRRWRDVEPMRLELVQLDRAMTIEEAARRFPSSIPIEQLALINHVEAGETLPRGSFFKRVLGFNPRQDG